MVIFIPLLLATFASILILNYWINAILQSFFPFESKYLPFFSWGFLVYFSVYRITRYFPAPTESVRAIYTFIAIFVPLIALIHNTSRSELYFRIKKSIFEEYWTVCLILVFLLCMILVGPYLEFPADSIIHLQRIQAWEAVIQMNYGRHYTIYSRFAYFFEHWLLKPSSLDLGNRSGILLLIPLLQTILFFQFIRITRILTQSQILGLFGGVISLGYFGYSAFSFYRYTALSGAGLAFICCFDGFILIIAAFSKEKIRYLLLLPPILLFTWGNHPQETLLQLNAIVGVSFALLIFRHRYFMKKFRFLMLLIIGVSLVFAIFTCLYREPLSHNILSTNKDLLLNTLPIFNGNMNIRYHNLKILNTMVGALGWLAMIGALINLVFNRSSSKEISIASALCVWPLLVVLNPIGIEILERFIPVETFHRLIYGSVYWIFLILLVQEATRKVNLKLNASNIKHSCSDHKVKKTSQKYICGIIVLFILLAWIPVNPIQGKMKHVFLKVNESMDGRDLKESIEYLRKSTPEICTDPILRPGLLPIRSFILSDPYVSNYLSTTGYFYTVTGRWNLFPGFESIETGIRVSVDKTDFDYASFVEAISNNNICHVILHHQIGEIDSIMGRVVGHWSPDHAAVKQYYSDDFIEWITDNPNDFQLVFENVTTKIFRVNMTKRTSNQAV